MAKVLVSIEDALLRRVDAAAAAQGVTRSAYLAALAERDLGRRGGPGASSDVREALARLDGLFARNHAGEDSTAAIRAERDAR